MPSGMNAKRSPGSRLPSWASLGAFVGAFAVFCLVWALILLAVARPAGFRLDHLSALPQSLQDSYTIGVYMGLPVAIALFWRCWEGRAFSGLGLRFAPIPFREGLCLGLGGILFIYGVSIALGWTRFRVPGALPWSAITLNLVAALAMGIAEEVLFRGLVLKTLLRDRSPWAAIGISGALYASVHFLRPGLTLAGSLLPFIGLFATGLLFGYAAWRTQTLWLTIGMHAVWIFFIALSSQYNLWWYADETILWTGAAYPPSGVLSILSMIGAFLVLRRKPAPPSVSIPSGEEDHAVLVH